MKEENKTVIDFTENTSLELTEEEDYCEKCKFECFHDKYLPSGNPCENCNNGSCFQPK